MKSLLLLPLIVFSAYATTIDIHYEGFQPKYDIAEIGNGSFSYADNLTKVGISDLTSFGFMLTSVNCGDCWEGALSPGTLIATSVFQLNQVTAFSFIPDPTYPILSAVFGPVSEDVYFVNDDTLIDGFTFRTRGVVSVIEATETPEPSTLAMLALGGLGLIAMTKKRLPMWAYWPLPRKP